MNEVAQTLTGWTQAAAEGQHIAEVFRIVNEDTGATVESPVERGLREGLIVGLTNHSILLAKDGRQVPIDDSAAPIRDENGMILGAVLVFHDITERKHSEEQQRRYTETFFNLVQNTPFGIYIVDADFRLLQISKGSKKVFANVDSPIGRDFAEILRMLWAEPFATEAVERFRHTLLTGEPFRSSNTTAPRGNIEDVESYDWKIERITLPDGRYGVVCYFYDLTERLQFEVKLRESEERMRLVLGASQLGIWIYDFTTQHVYRSAEHDEIFGTDNLEPTADAFFRVVHPEDVERVRAEFNRTVETHSLYEIEFRIIRPDGEERWIKNQGHVVGAAGSVAEDRAVDDVCGSRIDLESAPACRSIVRKGAANQIEYRRSDVFELDCSASSRDVSVEGASDDRKTGSKSDSGHRAALC